jgi:hypothetical protein
MGLPQRSPVSVPVQTYLRHGKARERGGGFAVRGSWTRCRLNHPSASLSGHGWRILRQRVLGSSSTRTDCPHSSTGSQPVLEDGYSTDVVATISDAKTRTRIGRPPRFVIPSPITRLGPAHPKHPPRLIRCPTLSTLTSTELASRGAAPSQLLLLLPSEAQAQWRSSLMDEPPPAATVDSRRPEAPVNAGASGTAGRPSKRPRQEHVRLRVSRACDRCKA